jgi:hypothetical protein
LLELHRAFVGAAGEYCADSVVPEFEALYAKLVRDTVERGCSNLRPHRPVCLRRGAVSLRAADAVRVNQRVDFTAHRTTFELAEYRSVVSIGRAGDVPPDSLKA